VTGDTRRSGGWTKRGDAYYARIRLGKTKRIEPRMAGVHDDASADERAEQIATVANLLILARRPHDVRKWALDIGACETKKAASLFVRAVEAISVQAVTPASDAVTFEQFALRWTSGQLHLDHPDHVAKKQSDGDENILKNRIRPIVGSVPLVTFTLEDADRVLRELPRDLSPAYRRAVAQVVHRVLLLAVYPAKIIKANPLPKGWLPKIGKPKAKSFLYPKEEAALLANKEIDVRYRMLIGVLCREGLRKSEARALTWDDIDLKNGTVTLDVNKTDAPRSWPLHPSVTRALVKWKKAVGGAGPFEGVDVQHLGEHLRGWLRESGVTRAQLFADTDQRMHFRAHDTRSTFVTLSLAEGKSEAWIMRRTAHRSSTMIARYAVSAANARELGLGPLVPLDKAIPELAKRLAVPTTNDQKRAGAARGRATQAAKRRLGEEWVKPSGIKRAKKASR
jgi:integrase